MIPNDIFDTLIGSLAIAAVKATHVTDGDEQTRQLIRIREARDWLNQLLVTVPVDATIETLHQSCDELQMQLDSEKVNTEYTEQLYEQASQRIDELEQLQTQPTYEPLPDGLINEDTRIMDNGTTIWQVIELFGDPIDSKIFLPDNIRLCRLVQQQPQGDSHE